jgi:hypothetical protein
VATGVQGIVGHGVRIHDRSMASPGSPARLLTLCLYVAGPSQGVRMLLSQRGMLGTNSINDQPASQPQLERKIIAIRQHEARCSVSFSASSTEGDVL